jgi:UrcA family protein
MIRLCPIFARELTMNTTHTRHNSLAPPEKRLPAHSALAPVAAALMLLAGGPACAADSTAPRATLGPVLTEKTIVVRVDDLDLATDSGTQIANERLLDATRRACDYTTAAGEYLVGRSEIHRACVARTMATATVRLEQLRLAAVLNDGAKVADNEATEAELPVRKISQAP